MEGGGLTMEDIYILKDRIDALECELEEIRGREEEVLPDYGYSTKDEIEELLVDEISRAREEMALCGFDYTPEELEEERTLLCLSQGLARFA